MVTRAEKANRMRAILRELLGERTYRWNELLDSSAKAYADKYPGEIEDMNDLKGKMGSVLSLMEDAGEMHFEANICSLVRSENDGNEKQTEEKNPSAEEKSEKPDMAGKESKPAAKEKKAAVKNEKTEKAAPKKQSEPAKKSVAPLNTEKKAEEKSAPAPRKRAAKKTVAAPAAPAASEAIAKSAEIPAQSEKEITAPVSGQEKTATEKVAALKSENAETPAAKQEPAAPVKEEKETPAPKKRGRKPKAEKAEEKAADVVKETTVAEGVAPKRRGRKPKAVQLLMPGAPEEVPVSLSEPENKAEKILPQQPAFDLTDLADAVSSPASPEEEKRELPKNEAPVSAAMEEKEETSSVQTPVVPEIKETKKEEKTPEEKETISKEGALTIKPEAKMAPVFDMTLLLGGGKKQAPKEASLQKPTAQKETVPASAPQKSPDAKENRQEIKTEKKPEAKQANAEEKASAAQPSREEKSVERRKEELVLSPAAAQPQETRRPVLPEFAFLGNASAKAAAANQRRNAEAPKESAAESAKEPARSVNAVGVKAESTVGKQSAPAMQSSSANRSKAEISPVSPAPSAAKSPASPVRETAKDGGQGNGNGNSSAGAGSSGPARGGRRNVRRGGRPTPALPETPEDALKAEFLKRLRSLGGDYFEYYSVYLLERYSLRNGRRLEGMRVSGGERDGGIDGEIELTDKFGFRETIYIQSKNWDPSKGDLEKWVVGETLLQQFIGAVACRQAKEGKQHSRGIFITTSHFTPEAKELLDTMSDKFIGYDSDDVFEAAKECSFGLVKKDGEWALDEELLSGGKAFFNLM